MKTSKKNQDIIKLLSQPLTIDELKIAFPQSGPNRARGLYVTAALIDKKKCDNSFSLSYNHEKCIQKLVMNSNKVANSFILISPTQTGNAINDLFHVYTSNYDTFLHYEKSPNDNVFGANRIYAYLYNENSPNTERNIFSAKTEYKSDKDEPLIGQPQQIFVDIATYADIIQERCNNKSISQKKCDISSVLVKHMETQREILDEFSFALYISCEAFCLGLNLDQDIVSFLNNANEGIPKKISSVKIETLYQECVQTIESFFI